MNYVFRSNAPLKVQILKGVRMLIKQYPFIKQLGSTDCGPACIAMLVKKCKGIIIPLGEIGHIIFCDENGSSFLGMKKGLKTLGINSEVYKCETGKDVFEEMSFPVITQIKKNNEFHFVIIYKTIKNHLLIADPLSANIHKISIQDFMKEWIPYVLEVKEINETDKLIYYKQKELHNNLFKAMFTYKRVIAFSWIISIIVYSLGIILAGMYSTFYDIIIPNKAEALIISMAMFYTMIIVMQMVLGLINVKLSIKINNGIDKSLTNKLLHSFFSKNFEVIESYKGGELITRFRNISQIRGRLVYIIQHFPIDVLTIVLTVIILFRQSIPLAIITLIPIILFLLIIYLSHDTMKKNSNDLFKRDEEYNTTLIQSIKNLETLKNYNVTEKYEKETSQKLNNLLTKLEKFVSFDTFQTNIKNLILSLFTIYIFALGAYLVINDNIADGMLLVFNSLSYKLFEPFQKFASLQALFEQGKIAQEKYEDIINTVMPRKEGNKKMEDGIYELSLHNVKFTYGVDTVIFNNIDLVLTKNSNIAILGDSGSGKTTLAKLIANYFDVDSGEMMINGVSYKQFTEETIRENILYVPQNVELFNDTILNNITLGRNISLDVIEEQAKILGFNEIIENLPKGYLTIIGENGLKLSMGQMQMLSILRSTLTNYNVIIFDEVTNGLDLHLREKVKQYLLNYGNIKIFITHDIEFAYSCDDISILKNNNIINHIKNSIGGDLNNIFNML